RGKSGGLGGLGRTMVGMVLGQSRVFFSMSKDRLLPGAFSVVHTRFRTPYISSITVGIFVGLFAGILPVSLLGELVSIGTLLAFVIVCAGVWILRKTNPTLHRPFKAPWVPLTPILGIGISLYMMVSLPPDTSIRFLLWLVIGMLIYFLYSRHHSRVQQGDRDF